MNKTTPPKPWTTGKLPWDKEVDCVEFNDDRFCIISAGGMSDAGAAEIAHVHNRQMKWAYDKIDELETTVERLANDNVAALNLLTLLSDNPESQKGTYS